MVSRRVRYKQANEEIARYVRQHPGRLIGFAKHDPRTEAGSTRQLLVHEVRELGLKGLKLHAVPTPEILEVVEDLRIPILMHPPRVGGCLLKLPGDKEQKVLGGNAQRLLSFSSP